jgi:succinylarginine dihydrolase
LPQGVLPPQERPDLAALRRLGFAGSDAKVLEDAHRQSPALLAACSSASSMWAANAATVSPSADTADGRVHFTPANLVTQFHRSLESQTTAVALRAIFADESAFAHHAPLPAAAAFSDEGAANHTRLGSGYAQRGIELFVYGRSAFEPDHSAPAHYLARQTLEASAAISRLHRLDPRNVLFAQQNPEAIDAGAFHNDVVAVGNLNVLLYHQRAFLNPDAVADRLRQAFGRLGGGELFLIEVTEQQVPR